MSWPRRLTLACGILLFAAGAAAETRTVTFRADDGHTIVGTLTEASQRPAPAVVLVGMLGRPRDEWHAVAERLAAANITSLAIDLRGQYLPADGSGTSWAVDVSAAVAFLAGRPEVRAWAIGVVGASAGANLAAVAAAPDPRVRSLVLVSPSLDYRGIRMEGPLRQYADRPALFVTSLRDPYAARSARELAAEAPGLREIQWAETAAHGTALLLREPDLVRGLVEWLLRTLG